MKTEPEHRQEYRESTPEQKYMTWYLQWLNTQGWRVISQSDAGVQVEKPKRWSVVGLGVVLVLGAIGLICLLINFWITVLAWILAGVIFVAFGIDYLAKQPQRRYITEADAKAAAVEYWAKQPKSS